MAGPIFVKVDEPDTIKDPVISVSVFILNPKSGEIEAVTDPLAIWDRFRPTIEVAGTSVNPAPFPTNDPVKNEAVTEFVTCKSPSILDEVLTVNPFSGEIDAESDPLAIWDKFKPVMAVAGISNKSTPEPEKLPLIPPVTLIEPVTCKEEVVKYKEALNSVNNSSPGGP